MTQSRTPFNRHAVTLAIIAVLMFLLLLAATMQTGVLDLINRINFTIMLVAATLGWPIFIAIALMPRLRRRLHINARRFVRSYATRC